MLSEADDVGSQQCVIVECYSGMIYLYFFH